MFNFRFSTESTAEQLQARVHGVLDAHKLDYELNWSLSGPPFLSPRGGLVDVVSRAIREVTGVTPALSTGGGTSDGRFLAAVSREVVEFGPLSASIHGIDEHVQIDDIGPLSAVYERTLAMLLSGSA
jgi:succinyl-diaminopimelate desuccinylase